MFALTNSSLGLAEAHVDLLWRVLVEEALTPEAAGENELYKGGGLRSTMVVVGVGCTALRTCTLIVSPPPSKMDCNANNIAIVDTQDAL